MAMYTSAALLAAFKRRAKRPATDESLTDADIYAYLSKGQEYWVMRLAPMQPSVLSGALVQMTTADSGKTYTFGTDPVDGTSNIVPYGHAEIYDATHNRPLRPGAEWDKGADFVPFGDHIAFAGGVAKPGPYFARFVSRPDVIDADTAPSLVPIEARELILARALYVWAQELGNVDPEPYALYERRLWIGDPRDPSDVGILGLLKTQYGFAGAEALNGSMGAWWRGVNLGDGYNAIVG